MNAPLLAVLKIASEAEREPLHWEHAFYLIKVFDCVPLIEHLILDFTSLKMLAEDNVPRKLPTLLNHLRHLELSGIDFMELHELSCTLCLIRSSPNLQKLSIEVYGGSNPYVEPALKYLWMQDYSNVSLNKLCEVEMSFTGSRPELEFIKFLLAISPDLERIHIEPSSRKIYKSRNKMLAEFTRSHRASQNVKIIFRNPDDALA